MHLILIFTCISVFYNANAVPKKHQKHFKNTGSQSAPIVAGHEAKKHEFPWIAALLNRTGHQFCGGSLISPKFVLTAAHCLPHFLYPVLNPSNFVVKLGAHNLSEAEKTSITVVVEKFIINPGYHIGMHSHDNAILLLKQYVTIRPGMIETICISSFDGYYANDVATIAGWGRLKFNGSSSDVLRKADISIWPSEKCKETFQEDLTDDMMCAGNPPKDTCQGDSGGPLMFRADNGSWILIGVVSAGFGCGQSPGLYSSVAYANPWIKKIVGEANLCVISTPRRQKTDSSYNTDGTGLIDLRNKYRTKTDRT